MPTNLSVQNTTDPTMPDDLNTYEMSCDTISYLYNFIGVTGQQVYVRGINAIGDGGQGPFYWNATGTAPDDAGVTTVVPSGSSPGNGEWTRIANFLAPGTVNGNLIVNGNLNVTGSTVLSSVTATSLAVSGNITAAAFTGDGSELTGVSGAQLKGTATNDVAAAGNVGEYITSYLVRASAVALTSGAGAAITSIELSAGEWDVWGQMEITGDTSTTVVNTEGNISTSSGSIGDGPVITNIRLAGATVFVDTNPITSPINMSRFSVSVPTTVFLNISATFGVSTCSGYGGLSARRVR